MNERRLRAGSLPHAADSGVCRRCGADLEYTALYVSHLGDWRCPRCRRARPPLDIAGSDIALEGRRVARSDRVTEGAASRSGSAAGVPGMYNAYNVARHDGRRRPRSACSRTVVQRALAAFTSAFGRIERVELAGRTITLALVKNPVGFNEVLRMLTMATRRLAACRP